MKTILISQRLIQVRETLEIREALDVAWGEFLNEIGFIPVPVSLKVPVEHYFNHFKPSGVILSGGNDLAVCNNTDPLNAKRDALEEELIRHAMERNLPVVGVCRGMQMIASYFGGSLEKKEGHVTKSHDIKLSQSRLSRHYQAKSAANSYHQYCVTKVGKELQIAASGFDQTIEAVEHKEKEIYGMMWHPERETPFSSQDLNFFKSIFSQQNIQMKEVQKS